MDRREFLRNSGIALAALALAPLAQAQSFLLEDFQQDQAGNRFAEGYVYHDRNGNGARAGNPGVAGVCVSNGREVVRTDRNGKWRLPVSEDTVLFVIKPTGWRTPVGPHNLPRFYYIHKPAGSPEYRYPGVAPTGPMPASIDFALTPQKEDQRFRMILFGDPQPRNQTEVDYIAHDVVEQVARDAKAVDAKFGLSLGDEMFDVLSLYDSLNGVIGTVGLPWYNTVGNHDMNYDSPDDAGSTETFQRVFGPTYYAFEYAKVHFLVLDDVMYHGKSSGGYHGELAPIQLEFVRNYLMQVPKDRLLVIAMHIPLVELKNRTELYRLIEDRPHTFSLSAHTHVQEHYFIGKEDDWRGSTPHHHLNHATVCGSWWEGAPDERGIPHATMSDGAPNGYSILEFEGTKYSVDFRAASRPAEEQMGIWVPDGAAAGSEVIVNVFAGSTRSRVEMRIGTSDWVAMNNFEGQDPYFLALKEAEKGPKPPAGLKLPNPSQTKHLWKAILPTNSAGVHRLEVRTTDMFGQIYQDYRMVRIS